MLTLLAAATVILAQPAAPVESPLSRGPLVRTEPGSVFCKTQGVMQTNGPDPALLYRNDGKPLDHRLGDLPRANLYHTVLRSVGGCAITKPVAFSVGR